MSLLPRALLKNYSQDALKPLEDECNAFDKVSLSAPKKRERGREKKAKEGPKKLI